MYHFGIVSFQQTLLIDMKCKREYSHNNPKKNYIYSNKMTPILVHDKAEIDPNLREMC